MGLKLTKAALLAYLKKYRKGLQNLETTASFGKPGAQKGGALERAHLLKDEKVRVGLRSSGSKTGLSRAEEKFGDALSQTPAIEKLTLNFGNVIKKRRSKVAKAAKRYRGTGGKLSDFKGPNPIYAKVAQLRKIHKRRHGKSSPY